MDENEWLRTFLNELVPEGINQSPEELSEDVIEAIFNADLDSTLYLNWERLMEMEAAWAEKADTDYAIPVGTNPYELTELLPLFLSRENAGKFVDEHFIECTTCSKSVFLGFHISPTIPFPSVNNVDVGNWKKGKKRINVQVICPECSNKSTGSVPPAIPPHAWLRWWSELGPVLKEPIAEKLHNSRRIDVLNLEQDVKHEVPRDDVKSPYYIPIVVEQQSGSKLAIDAVRSMIATQDRIQEELHNFHTVCEQNGIEEKLFIVVGGMPKADHSNLLSLKKWYLKEQFNGNAQYRNLYFHTITYPEELDLILNQMLYKYLIEGTDEGPSIYDINNWERRLLGIDSESGKLEERGHNIDALGTAKGPLIEQIIREYFESQGYRVRKSDELDHHKVDLFAERGDLGSKEVCLIQCKAGKINENEVEGIQSNFSDVQSRITDYYELFIDDIDVRYMLVVGDMDDYARSRITEADIETKTLGDLWNDKDNISPHCGKSYN